MVQARKIEFPQGLKPECQEVWGGTAEAVPFQSQLPEGSNNSMTTDAQVGRGDTSRPPTTWRGTLPSTAR